MKQTVIFLILFSATILFAQFGSLQEIYEGDRLSIENSNSIICQGDTVLTCFKESSRTIFGISFDNGANFEYTELFFNQNDWQYYSISYPEIVLLSDNTIHIFGNTSAGMVLYSSYDLGQTFENELFEGVKKYRISQNEDSVYLITNNEVEEERESRFNPGIFETILSENKNEKSYADSYIEVNRKQIEQWNNLKAEEKETRTVDEIFEMASIHGRRVVADSADIAFIELNGEVYHGYEGVIQFNGYDTLNVYSWYPANAEQVQMALDSNINWFEDSNIIAQNFVPKYETVWTEISGEISNKDIFYVEGDLWIQGEVKGKQLWYANGNLRILGDIYLAHTDIGDNPDGHYTVDDTLYNYERPINGSDYIGLSTNKIGKIAYKHFDPASGNVVNNNSDEDGYVNIYAAISCIGVADYPDSHNDGHFTFEYQHPHGSTPDFTGISPYTGNDTIYTNIDLHKFIMDYSDLMLPELSGFELHGNNPINGMSCGYPYETEMYINSIPNNEDYVYPYGTDYPWYNPVWPESADEIVFERGTCRIRGSLAQRRRGFMHRSGTDPYNHQNNVWDLENYHYDGEHSSTGYDKDWESDSRLSYLSGFSPIGQSSLEHTFNLRKFSNGVWEDLNSFVMNDYLGDNDVYLYLALNGSNSVTIKKNYNSLIYSFFDEDSNISIEGEIPEFRNEIISIKLVESGCYILSKNYDLGDDQFQIFIHKLNFNDSSLIEVYVEEIPYQQEQVAALELDSNGNPHFAYFKENEGIYFRYNYSETGFNSEYLWDADFADIPNSMSLIQTEAGEFNILLSDGISYGTSKLQFAEGTLELTDSEDIELPKPVVSLSNFPNPFNPTTEIRFQISDLSDKNSAEIEIFNVKGQKVKSYLIPSLSLFPINSVTWNGTDRNNHPVASGIYYYTLKLDGKIEARRKMVLLK